MPTILPRPAPGTQSQAARSNAAQSRKDLAVPKSRNQGLWCPNPCLQLLRCALTMPVGPAARRGRNEARWRNEKGSAIGIAGATAFRFFSRRQIPQFDCEFLPGRFLLGHSKIGYGIGRGQRGEMPVFPLRCDLPRRAMHPKDS